MTKTSIFKKIGLTALAAPLAVIMSMAAPTAADAFGLQNCTGNDIRVHVFNDNDSVKLRAEKNHYIYAGDLAKWNSLAKRKKYVRVYDAGVLDRVVYSTGNLNRDWDYRVTLSSDGNWNIVPAGHPVSACP